MLWLVCFLYYADRQAVFALFPLLRESLKLSDLQLALVGSSFMWMYALTGPLAGWLGDWLSRKVLICCGLMLWVLVTVSTVFARDFHQLAFLRAVGGLSEAVYFPAAMSLISSYHDPQTRSRAMSLLQSAVYTGTIGGGTIATVLGEHLGWRSSFISFAILGLLLLMILLVFLRNPGRDIGDGRSTTENINLPRIPLHASFREIFLAPLALRLTVSFVGANFVAMTLMVWLPTFLYRKFQMTLAMSGVTSTLYLQGASICGVLLGGVLADVWAHRSRGGRMLTQAGGLLLGAPFLLLTGSAVSLPMLVVGMVGFGFCKGVYDSNIWASLHDVVRPECRAGVVGITNSLGWIGGGIGPLVLAAASKHIGMGTCLSLTSLVYLLVAGILLWNARQMNFPMDSRHSRRIECTRS